MLLRRHSVDVPSPATGRRHIHAHGFTPTHANAARASLRPAASRSASEKWRRGRCKQEVQKLCMALKGNTTLKVQHPFTRMLLFHMGGGVGGSLSSCC